MVWCQLRSVKSELHIGGDGNQTICASQHIKCKGVTFLWFLIRQESY